MCQYTVFMNGSQEIIHLPLCKLIILTSLTLEQRFFWILFVRTRLVRMITGKFGLSNVLMKIEYTLFQSGHWFMGIKIGPCCLVQDKIFFWTLILRTRHQGLIWTKTKEYLNGVHWFREDRLYLLERWIFVPDFLGFKFSCCGGSY